MTRLSFLLRAMGRTRRLARDTSGAAAVEMALWAVFIIVPMLSVTDVGFYAYRRMQVELAAQAAASAAWNLCSTAGTLPATQKCTGLLAAMTTAAQGSSLGTAVTVASGYPLDSYYCLNGTSALVQMTTPVTIGSAPTLVTSCTSGATPGEYLQVKTTYTNTNLFRGISVASLLPSPITKIAWVRLN